MIEVLGSNDHFVSLVFKIFENPNHHNKNKEAGQAS